MISHQVQKGGRAVYDVNGQNIVQTDNETYESTITGKNKLSSLGYIVCL